MVKGFHTILHRPAPDDNLVHHSAQHGVLLKLGCAAIVTGNHIYANTLPRAALAEFILVKH